MLLTLFLISMRSCDFFSLPPGKEEKAQGFIQNLDIRWSGLSLIDLWWSQQKSNGNVALSFSPPLRGVDLNELNVLQSTEERCSGLSPTLPWCPVVSLIHSGFWCQRSAGQNGGQEKHLHWNALLDGPRGHCLRWKSRCHLRLQGTYTSIFLLFYTSLQMCVHE